MEKLGLKSIVDMHICFGCPASKVPFLFERKQLWGSIRV